MAFSSLFSHFNFCSLKVRVILSDLSAAAAAAAAAGIIAHIYTWELTDTTVIFCTNNTKILMVTVPLLCFSSLEAFLLPLTQKSCLYPQINLRKQLSGCVLGPVLPRERELFKQNVHRGCHRWLMWIHIRNYSIAFSLILPSQTHLFSFSWQWWTLVISSKGRSNAMRRSSFSSPSSRMSYFLPLLLTNPPCN